MRSNFAPNSSSSRNKDKKKTQTENRGNNLAALCPSLCITGMVDLKPTEVEVEQIELVQWSLFYSAFAQILPVTHLWVHLLTPCTLLPHYEFANEQHWMCLDSAEKLWLSTWNEMHGCDYSLICFIKSICWLDFVAQ